jgi:hypothetical protein
MMERPLSGLKDAIKADYAVRSFRQALAIILKTATEQNGGEDDYAIELLQSLWPSKEHPIAKRRDAALPMRTWEGPIRGVGRKPWRIEGELFRAGHGRERPQ